MKTDTILNSKDCKAGERWLVRNYLSSGEPYEITIVEWAPSGSAVKVEYASGSTQWLQHDKPYIVEKLPGSCIGKFGPSKPTGRLLSNWNAS
jgi:hypothetical protein